jgi:thiamine biosynthesis lipoprotein
MPFFLRFFFLYSVPVITGILIAIPAPAQKKYVFESAKMGSPFTITICTNDSAKAARAASAAFKKADTLNAMLSDYIDSSEINRLSATAGQARYVPVSAELFNILNISLQAAQLSRGSYDVTIGPVVALWRKARKSKTFPQKDSIKAALQKVGYQYLHLDSLHQSVWLEKPGMRLDIGGLGKGFVAQIALNLLNDSGFAAAMVNAGGKIVLGDAPPGTEGWLIGINVPEEKQAVMQQLLVLKNTAVATSGDVYQNLEFNGKKYSHIVNPKTGIGLTRSSNVTAIASGGAVADWLATACSILSPKKAFALIKQFSGGALLVTRNKNGRIWHRQSPGFQKFMYK